MLFLQEDIKEELKKYVNMEGGEWTEGYASPRTNTDAKILCDFRQGKG